MTQKKYDWATNFNQYINTMTRGHGYGGEKFWDEEEKFLRERFTKKVRRSLNVGCGLFRELDTLRHISSDLVWGMDSKKEFIDYKNLLKRMYSLRSGLSRRIFIRYVLIQRRSLILS